MPLSNADQYMLELLNRARSSPVAEAARHGIPLNQGGVAIGPKPVPPLAPDSRLQSSAEGHAEYLAANGLLTQESENGMLPAGRAAIQGYVPHTIMENLSAQTGILSQPALDNLHRSMFLDPAKRQQMFWLSFKDYGGSVATGDTPDGPGITSVQDFGFILPYGTPYLTGVVYTDDGSGAYSLGSGIGGVAVQAGPGFSVTDATGGYKLVLPKGTYTVTFLQGATVLKTASVKIGDHSVKLDCAVGGLPPVAVGFADPGFELPVLPPTAFEYQPAGSPWTFTPGGGITKYGNGWGAYPAPQGSQVAFLQALGSVGQTVSVPAAGQYSIQAKLSRRTNWGGQQTVRVRVDGTEAGVCVPASSSWQPYAVQVGLTAGSHTVAFEGVNPADATAFLDDVTVTKV